jgi:uncharacterized membrane protein YfcA
MGSVEYFGLLSIAVFCGAFVSGLAGFAFSAVAGAVLLHVLPPLEAVPLMMACSIAVQATNLWALRKHIRWKESLILVVGGLLGVPIAICLLQMADARVFTGAFGLAVACYAAYMLFRPALSYRLQMNAGRNALIGFSGGFVGGLTGMPGAIPTIWCDIHGVPKTEQRGMVQPFIAAMQIFALVLMLVQKDLSTKVLIDFAASIPALLAGTALGIMAFRSVDDALFRRIILSILLVSGLMLIL